MASAPARPAMAPAQAPFHKDVFMNDCCSNYRAALSMSCLRWRRLPDNRWMDVRITQQPEVRVGTVRHIGPYETIAQAFERLGAVLSGAKRPPSTQLLALYYDDPQTT